MAKEKKQGKRVPPSSDLKSTLESTMIYEDKHYSRVERQLRSSYFVDYLVSQMTLQDEEPKIELKKRVKNEDQSGKKSNKKRKRSISS